ncbi:MAG: hypothetical protein WEE50_11920 [Chloroflexota bacterium]
MADDAIERVLRLVGDGHLTAEEAGPILDALADRPPRPPAPSAADVRPSDNSPAQALRIQVYEAGRTVVNLRVPLALGRAAIGRVPGISDITSERIREAIAAGIKGPVVEVEDNGDGVRISIE